MPNAAIRAGDQAFKKRPNGLYLTAATQAAITAARKATKPTRLERFGKFLSRPLSLAILPMIPPTFFIPLLLYQYFKPHISAQKARVAMKEQQINDLCRHIEIRQRGDQKEINAEILALLEGLVRQANDLNRREPDNPNPKSWAQSFSKTASAQRRKAASNAINEARPQDDS